MGRQQEGNNNTKKDTAPTPTASTTTHTQGPLLTSSLAVDAQKSEGKQQEENSKGTQEHRANSLQLAPTTHRQGPPPTSSLAVDAHTGERAKDTSEHGVVGHRQQLQGDVKAALNGGRRRGRGLSGIPLRRQQGQASSTRQTSRRGSPIGWKSVNIGQQLARTDCERGRVCFLAGGLPLASLPFWVPPREDDALTSARKGSMRIILPCLK